VSEQDFAEGMALCQAVPGATMVQMSTYVGYRLRGAPGAAAAALGFILPSAIVMVVLSALYFHAATLPVIQAVFRGLGAVVVAIVLDACLGLGRTMVGSWQQALIALLALGALGLGVHFVLVLAGAAGLAVLLYRVSELRPPGARRAP
jgi:chromate transporter